MNRHEYHFQERMFPFKDFLILLSKLMMTLFNLLKIAFLTQINFYNISWII